MKSIYQEIRTGFGVFRIGEMTAQEIAAHLVQYPAHKIYFVGTPIQGNDPETVTEPEKESGFVSPYAGAGKKIKMEK